MFLSACPVAVPTMRQASLYPEIEKFVFGDRSAIISRGVIGCNGIVEYWNVGTLGLAE
jgi:hypothetical protein